MYNLLFVDDDPWILESMKEILNWNLFSLNPPYIANNVDEAKKIFRNASIHILITDIEMIGNSGFDLLSWVSSEYPGTLTAFLTCHARFDFAQQAINLGVFGYLLKPLQEQALIDFLEKCLQRLGSNQDGDVPMANKPHYSETIEKAIEYIQKNLGSSLTRESISKELYISESYLSRTFAHETGQTLSEYITEKRIDYAKELLTDTTLSITDISLKVGYNFAAYFSKIFKEKTGMTPNQWRDSNGLSFHSSSVLNNGSQNCI